MPNRCSFLALVCLLTACEASVERPPAPEHQGVFAFSHGCYTMDATRPGSDNTRWLAPTEEGEAYALTARTAEEGARFYLQPADLGVYLFFDAEGRYLVASDEGALGREESLLSDTLLIEDGYQSEAEWQVEISSHDESRLQLRHVRTGRYFGVEGLVEAEADAAVVALYPAEVCTAHPELTLDAEGEVEQVRFDDDDIYGIVDTHSHIFSNLAFGGGGIFHGAPYHRLGVEHALSDCERFHGREGRSDLMGFAFDSFEDVEQDTLITALATGRLPEFNHHTAGYPDFTSWPDAHASSTHQTQYWRWIERAYLAGLRFIVQHATTNRVICELMTGNGSQPVRYSCNEMVSVDRIIEDTYALERYIDAQFGGPGRGWFRVVTSPNEAREVIRDGRLAVMLGIETSNVFDCFLVPPEGTPACDEARVIAELDRYHALGIRALFPVHKFDNAFSAGDGHKSFIEAGNFANSGHWSNFTADCDSSVPTVFDRGNVFFGGLNMPRDDYFGPAPNDVSGFADNPVAVLVNYLDELTAPQLEGDYCQNAGLTPLGETLIREMMARGMIIEVDHLPRRAYVRAFELLEEHDYPAAGTHGLNYDGRIYAVGGVSKTGLGRCRSSEGPGAMMGRFNQRAALIRDAGGYPAEGFGFDLNGFAGAPGPRFGERSSCGEPQEEPLTYPFTSYAGDVTFTEPRVGNRVIDFNTEGFVHLGMLPELIEDARRDGATDEELEVFFRSAEGYIRMWERAEERAGSL